MNYKIEPIFSSAYNEYADAYVKSLESYLESLSVYRVFQERQKELGIKEIISIPSLEESYHFQYKDIEVL